MRPEDMYEVAMLRACSDRLAAELARTINELAECKAALARVEASARRAIETIDIYPVSNEDAGTRAYIIAVGRAADHLRAALKGAP